MTCFQVISWRGAKQWQRFLPSHFTEKEAQYEVAKEKRKGRCAIAVTGELTKLDGREVKMKDLIRAAKEAVEFLDTIAESEDGPGYMPFPEADKLRQEIEKALIEELEKSEQVKT